MDLAWDWHGNGMEMAWNWHGIGMNQNLYGRDVAGRRALAPNLGLAHCGAGAPQSQHTLFPSRFCISSSCCSLAGWVRGRWVGRRTLRRVSGSISQDLLILQCLRGAILLLAVLLDYLGEHGGTGWLLVAVVLVREKARRGGRESKSIQCN